MSKKFYKKTFEFLSIIFIIAIVVKIAQQTILPEKYFYDSKKILVLMDGFYEADRIYIVTAQIFNFINILKLDSLVEWSIILGIIFNIVVFCVLLFRNKSYTMSEYIFIYASIALLNIYVFNLSKDIIQFVVFFIIYAVIVNSKIKNFTKIILITTILIIEALTFRIYYGIMAMLLISIYCVYLLLMNKNRLNKSVFTNIIIVGLAIFFIEIFIVSIISDTNYQSILYARSSVNMYREDDTDSVTIITDVLGENTNFVKFIGNYIINFIRMLIPVELLLKGVKYLPFVIYQIYVSIKFFKTLKNISHSNIVLTLTLLTFFMISVIFEPDFGSWIRHESAMMLIIIEMIKNIDNQKLDLKTEKIYEEIGENNIYDKS